MYWTSWRNFSLNWPRSGLSKAFEIEKKNVLKIKAEKRKHIEKRIERERYIEKKIPNFLQFSFD